MSAILITADGYWVNGRGEARELLTGIELGNALDDLEYAPTCPQAMIEAYRKWLAYRNTEMAGE